MRYFFTLLLLGQILMATTIEQIKTTDGEIPLIVEQDKRLPLVTMQLTFKDSGSITDKQKAGLAKLSAKMMNEGTKALGASKFALELESRAIHISSSVGVETFVMELSTLKEELPFALEKIKALLAEPNLTQESLDKVKTMTLGSLSRKENDFDYVASNELKAILFEGTPLANPSLGTPQSIQSITLDDVKEFVKKHLVISRLIVSVGGDVESKKIVKDIASLSDVLEKGKSETVPFYDVRKDAKEVILKRDTEQAYIYFGSPYMLKENDSEAYKAKVAAFVLGAGGFGSRLMEEIRVKRGLAYSAYGRVTLAKSRSYFSGYLQTKTDSLVEAQKAVKEVIEQFLDKGITQEELDQTKRFLLGSEPLRIETMSQRVQRAFMEYYTGKEQGASHKELEKIEELTLDDINAFIKKHQEILTLSFSIVTK
jgi:predicted Zn-dependent peptidase